MHGKLQGQQTVEVDEDEVVDGGTKQDDLHAGHNVARPVPKLPPKKNVSRGQTLSFLTS